MTQFTVRYFAAAAEIAGTEREEWNLADASSLASLRAALGERYGSEMMRVVRSGSMLVDGVAQFDADTLDGSVIDVLPPFAGG
jgi:molybdopterin synthase sulfur carrier subunit